MHVWGQVTFDGKPVDTGTIEFTPTEGTTGEANRAEVKAGKYDIPAGVGPSKGTYKVTITADRPVPGKVYKNPFGNRFKNLPPIEEMENYIPDKYSAQSTLKVTVSEDASKNQFDFTLEPGPVSKGTTRRRR
jgi:hypothetical protein